jgi:hypothetical protein
MVFFIALNPRPALDVVFSGRPSDAPRLNDRWLVLRLAVARAGRAGWPPLRAEVVRWALGDELVLALTAVVRIRWSPSKCG